MITTWSPHSKTTADTGGAAAMIDYLVSEAVSKPARGPGAILVRDPAPEILSGDPGLVRDLINALPWQHGYSTVTMSFAEGDIPVLAFNAGKGRHRDNVGRILRLFGEVAFAGIRPVHRPPLFVGTHTHTGRLEVNVAVPRMVQRPTGEVRSYNPHPPTNGSRSLWDGFTDVINSHFGYADPRGPDHMRLAAMPNWRLKQRAEAARGGLPSHGSPWSALAAHALTLYHCDEVSDRRSLLEAMEQELIGRGIEILRVSDDSTTFGSPGGESWRMRGYLFSARFDRDAARGDLPEQDLQALRDLELQAAPARLQEALLRRAAFNASRHRGTCPVPDPLSVLREPPLPMPSCHPQTLRTKVPRRMTYILSRLAKTIGQVADRLQDRLRDILALNAIADLDLSPLTNIRQTLETLNARYIDKRAALRSAGTAEDNQDAGGADRTTADDPRHGTRTGRWRSARRVAGGAVVDQHAYPAGSRYDGGRAGSAGRGTASPGAHGGSAGGDAVRDESTDGVAWGAATKNAAAKLRWIREAADVTGMTNVSIRTLGSAILLRADGLVVAVREGLVARERTRSPEAREMLEALCAHAGIDLPVRDENREMAPGL